MKLTRHLGKHRSPIPQRLLAEQLLQSHLPIIRIALAEIGQETDSFSPIVADLDEFQAYGLYLGDEVLERMPGAGPIGGFLAVAGRQSSVELVPLMRAWGNAGGAITASALDYLLERFTAGLTQALPIDALFLSLHGAAASERDDDVEGLVLAAARQIVGREVPIAVALDHHANVTQRMVDNADLLVGHETQPHDPPATGRKAAELLFRLLKGEVRPKLAWRKIPMITPQDQFLTSAGPMKQWFDLARRMEQRAGVLDVSPFPMQPWLDASEGGWAVTVHTDNDQQLAEKLADEMADEAWKLREAFWASERVPAAEAVRQASAAERGLIILSDTGDSVYGGAPGDNTCLLRALLEAQLSGPALVPVIDAQAVAAAAAAGVGAKIDIELGGKLDTLFCQAVKTRAEVAAVSSGFVVDLYDRGICDLKRTALLRIGQVYVALLDHRSFTVNHPVLYTHLGLDVADAKMVVVKTASNFQFFSRWRQGLIRVDTPGTTQSDLRAFDWKRIPRPIWPLDEMRER